MSTSLRLEGISKRFGGVVALNNVSIEAAHNEFVVLLGPSGCGKSTLLRIIAGLDQPDEGRVLMGERDVTALEPRDRDVAMVFQSYALYPHWTVADNIGYPLKLRKWKPTEAAAEVTRVATSLGLDKLLSRRPRDLSGGERQRVALARAIVRRPKAFLMDEPLSNIDARHRVEMRVELKHLQHQLGTLTVYVTHDQAEAMTLAHRIAVMQAGRILQFNTPLAVYKTPANLFVAGFVGSPPMNLLAGEADEGAFRHPALTLALAVHGLPRKVTVGFRPEDVDVMREPAPGYFPARLFVVEELGESVIVVLDANGTRLTARLKAGWISSNGAPLWYRPRPGKVHLFDTSTGERISESTAS